MIWRDYDLEATNVHMERLRWKRRVAAWLRSTR